MAGSQADFFLQQGILRSARDYAIITIDEANLVTSWSAGAEVLLEWSADEMLGRSAEIIFTPEDRAKGAVRDELETAARTGRAEDERWHVRRSGAVFWGSGVMFPLQDHPGFVKIMRDRSKERQAVLDLARSEQRFRSLVEQIPQLVWRSGPFGQRIWGSPQWRVFAGQTLEESVGLGWLSAIHPQDRDATLEAWHEGERTGALYIEHRTRRAEDGEYRWFQTRGVRLAGADGEVEWFGTSTDLHELRRAVERQQVLLRELHHRTRNLLSVVNAIAHQTLSRSGNLTEFGGRFSDRLSALGRVQALVARTDGSGIALRDLVESEIDAHTQDRDGRVKIEGPPVILRETAGETVALALHELSTNALKYGALATAGGQLSVTWRTPAGLLCLEWQESGAAHVPSASRRRGYGRELIETALPFALGARTKLEFGNDGVHCCIELPQPEWDLQHG